LALLEVSNLSKSFGGVHAVRDVDMQVEALAICGIIGPNGAGKSTLINLISGFYKPLTGTITHRGQDITGLPSHRLAQVGIARTFQHTTSFPDMTVVDAVAVAEIYMNRISICDGLFKPSKVEKWKVSRLEKSYEALRLVGLQDRANVKCKNLPHGEQVALDIAIAIATEAKLLLLDEPASGLNATEIEKLMDVVRILKSRGATIVIVEHHMAMVMNICERIVVLNEGRKIAEGNPKEIQDNQVVVEAYLGRDAALD